MHTKYSSQLDNRFEPILACNSFRVLSASSTAESVHYLDELLTCRNRREKLKCRYFGLLQLQTVDTSRTTMGEKAKTKICRRTQTNRFILSNRKINLPLNLNASPSALGLFEWERQWRAAVQRVDRHLHVTT